MKLMKERDPVFDTLDPKERDLVEKMHRKGVSRREALSFLIGTGASLAAANAVLSSAARAATQTPKRGGRLVFAGDQHGPNDTLDPAQFYSAVDYFRGRMYYGSLTRLTDKLGYEPELAEEILSNADATVWTFKLRRGVEFHDGKTLTADDVIYSMNRHIGKDSVSSAKGAVTMIDRWEKVGDYEVRAVLNAPNADLPVILGTFHFKIIQDGTTDFSTAIGTGPYKVKEFKPGVRTVGERFDNYWTEGAYLDELEHYGIGDPVSRLNAFLAGNVDAMVNVPPQAIPQINAAEGREIWEMSSGSYINLSPRHDDTLSGNADLQRAFQHLIDRERLLKGVYKNHATLGNDQPINAAYADFCPDIPQRVMDPDKAKYHFDKSGIGGTPIPLHTAELSPGCVEQCLFLQREGEKIGMNVEIKKVATDGYWGTIWRKKPFAVGVINMRPTTNMFLSLLFGSKSPVNETGWSTPHFDQLLEASRGETDPEKRKQMYCDLQTMLHEQNGQMIPVHRNYVDAAASHVKGLTHVPLVNFGGAEAAPTLWRDS